MKTAIIGLPMVGKTSLFTILTGAHQETRIGSTAVHLGVAKVPDARLEELAKLFEPKKVTHAAVEYVDMPAISKESLRDAGYVASLRMAESALICLRNGSAVFAAGALENVLTALLRSGQLAVRQAVAVGTQRHRLDIADQVAQLLARITLRAVEILFGARSAFGFQVRIAAIPLERLGAIHIFQQPVVHDVLAEAIRLQVPL